MHRTSLGFLAIVALTGCGQSTAPAPQSVATPVAVTPASAAPLVQAAAPTEEKVAAVASTPTAPAATAPKSTIAPKPRAAAKPIVGDYAANVPPVMLSASQTTLCSIGVGDEFPAIALPKLDGGQGALESLAGAQATVVVFWTPDRWMAHTALSDLARDLAANPDRKGVAVVGIAVGGKTDEVQAEVGKSGAKFTQLVDADGQALAQCGAAKLPRVYVLDAERKIAWFDIEYSEATRRELHDTLAALTAVKR